MGQAQINVRTRACSRTSIARTKQAALTHSVRGKEFKCSAYFANFELEKMSSMRSAQRQVELRRLGNQLPVLGKANSLCKSVTLCVFCMFRLSQPGMKIFRGIVVRAKYV